MKPRGAKPQAEKDVSERVGYRIFVRRKALGMTLHQLGRAIGRSPQQIAKHEDGTTTICVGRLVLIANALGTTPAALLDGISYPRNTGAQS